MLVLSRKVNEQICIGADIVITVVDVGNSRVRIGIEAPRDMPIVRHEIQVAEQPAQLEATRNA